MHYRGWENLKRELSHSHLYGCRPLRRTRPAIFSSIARLFFLFLSLWNFGNDVCSLAHAQDVNSAQAALALENLFESTPDSKINSIGTIPAQPQDWLSEINMAPAVTVLPQRADTQPANHNLASPQVVEWLSQMIRANLPPVYEDVRQWGKQKEVWDGVDFQRDGLRIETHSKRKLVNDGTWTRYRVEPLHPEHRMKIEFHRLEAVTTDGKVHFDVSVELPLDVFGRLSQWVRDVQLISLSANADAVCRFNIKGTVEFRLNPLTFPPDVTIKPKVEQARVDVVYFRVRRISQLGGPLAKHLGNGLKRVLDDKLEDTNAKLVDKINAQLEKKSDRMAFSTQAWLQSKLPLPTAK